MGNSFLLRRVAIDVEHKLILAAESAQSLFQGGVRKFFVVDEPCIGPTNCGNVTAGDVDTKLCAR